jgi:hypothetical protein
MTNNDKLVKAWQGKVLVVCERILQRRLSILVGIGVATADDLPPHLIPRYCHITR